MCIYIYNIFYTQRSDAHLPYISVSFSLSLAWRKIFARAKYKRPECETRRESFEISNISRGALTEAASFVNARLLHASRLPIYSGLLTLVECVLSDGRWDARDAHRLRGEEIIGLELTVGRRAADAVEFMSSLRWNVAVYYIRYRLIPLEPRADCKLSTQ